MQSRGDEQLRLALLRLLDRGPLDILDVVRKARTRVPALIRGREGVMHPLILRALLNGDIAHVGTSERGLSLYGLERKHSDGEPRVAGAQATSYDDAFMDPVPPATQRAVLRIARGVQDPFHRGRIVRDIYAHQEDIASSEHDDSSRPRFGSKKAIHMALHRVSRGRRSVLAPATAGDSLKRLLLHEGPWIASALALFIVAKMVIVDVYRIPSPSMVPTLNVGDRIVVRKFATNSAQERWRIWTFRRDPKTYVKRMVGLPGETIAIHGGDVYINGEIAEKPDALNDALRRPLGTWDFRESKDTRQSWRRISKDGTHRWVWDGGRLSPDGLPSHHASRYSIPLLDAYATLHAQRTGKGICEVTLARLAKTSGETAWTFHVGPDGARVVERVRPVSVPGETPVPDQERVLWRDKRVLRLDGSITMSLALIDGLLIATVGDVTWKGRVDAPRDGLRFEVAAAGDAALHTFSLDADQHWSNAGIYAVTDSDEDPAASGLTLGGDSFFFLGDNTTDSADSRTRQMGNVHRSELIAPVIFKVWPFADMGSPE